MTEAKDTGAAAPPAEAPAWRFPALLALLLSVPLVLDRLVQTLQLTSGIRVADLRGVSGDLGASCLLGVGIAVAFMLPKRLFRFPVALLWFFAWILLAHGNFEHTKILGNTVSTAYVEFLFDATFVKGSALQLSSPWLLALSAVFGGVVLWRLSRERTSWKQALMVAGAALVLSLFHRLLPVSGEVPSWRQNSFVLENLLWSANEEELVASDADLAGYFPADASGELVRPQATGKQNVLLIVLEGVSGAYVDPVAEYQGFDGPRPRLASLSKVAASNTTFANFLTHQRQTNRGLYTLLCGDIPKIITASPKMTELGWGDAALPCLPNELRNAGYQTSFVQAAPLGFMSKDRFMPRAGFDTVHGAEWFKSGGSAGKWGVNDDQFFQQSLRELERVKKDGNPWFVTMLTSGTHHPFNVPKDFESDYAPKTFAHSVAFLDTALARFLTEIETRGLGENTLIVITSDESFGLEGDLSADQMAVAQAWGTLTLVFPDARKELVTETFSQADVAHTLLDYLSIRPPATMGGRSTLRHYAASRAIGFGNTYLRMVLGIDTDLRLFACNETFSGCRKYATDPDHLFGKLTTLGSVKGAEVQFLKDFASRSLHTASAAPDDGVWTLLESGKHLALGKMPKRNGQIKLFGSQYLALEEGDALELEVELRLRGKKARATLKHVVYAVARRRMPSGTRFRAQLDGEAERLGLGESQLGMRPRFAPSASTLHRYEREMKAGETVRLHYRFTAKEAMERIDSQLRLQGISGRNVRLQVIGAELRRAPGDDTPGVKLLEPDERLED